MQKCVKLDQAFMKNVEKTSNRFLNLEDYHYDILNIHCICKDTIRESFESEHRKSINNVREVCNVYVKMGVRRLLAGRRRTKSNTRGKDLVWFLSRVIAHTCSLVRRQEYLSMHRIDAA